MNIKKIGVRNIILSEFNQEKSMLNIEINFEDNEPKLFYTIALSTPEQMTQKILNYIKQEKTPIEDDNEFLNGYYSLAILNREDVEAILKRSLAYLLQRFKNMKKTTNANEYIRLYNQFKTIKETLYDRIGFRPQIKYTSKNEKRY